MSRLEGHCYGEDNLVHITRGFINQTLCGQAATSLVLGPMEPGRLCEKCKAKMKEIDHELRRV